ncbi:hypothetical protein [Streptomyces sp. NPDC058157]|uniref:hypothetical protein n=1 Tax=Streptomyces sp. NPDC058157 TaxID=3346360 RepID=UPI0036F10CEA
MTHTPPPVRELSPSVYDIAVTALVDGPQQQACVQWLSEHRTTPTTWGADPQVNWYDAYLSTYSAALALHHAGDTEVADRSLADLPRLVPADPRRTLETLTFGALIGALDTYHALHIGPPAPHPPPVREVIEREAGKWRRMKVWDGFLDPAVSIAGYCAERVLGDDDIDLEAFLDAFQAPNGSVANAPGASALLLLEAERRGTPPTPALRSLRDYVHARQAPDIAYLDWVPYFTSLWSSLFTNETGPSTTLPSHALDALIHDLADPSGLMGSLGSIRPHGPATIPGDSDVTACAMVAARLHGRTPPPSTNLDSLYDPTRGCYLTFHFEHDASLTTNIHVAHALALEERTDRLTDVLTWLTKAFDDPATIGCKWHLSPLYALGELARVTAHIGHPLATALHDRATTRLLTAQNPDGGWGTHGSTAEETGYAVLGLTAALTVPPDPATPLARALRHAHRHLTADVPRHVPLWLGKTLYCVEPLVPLLHATALTRIEQVTLD